MKRRTINLSWPATLSFSADNENENENELFSRGKLKVFYKGETEDHRYFSDEFSEELVKSLPYTPIVSYYDEDKDDFVGHATEQAIYGIVDPCGKISFEEDDKGITWAICDTVYYTKRPDKVGEIAKKIEGHSQSLELDPNTVKYTVNYDNKKHFKNIEFTAGRFVGVSVLGKNQKPAFTGSEFFSSNSDFEEKMKLLKEYCEQKNDATQYGGKEMNLQEFMTLSWGDKSQKVVEALNAEYGNEYYLYVMDFFDDSVVINTYSYLDGSIKLLRVNYTCDENAVVVLGDAKEVHVVYEDMPEQASPNATLEEGVDNTDPSLVNAEKKEGNIESDEDSDEESNDKSKDEPDDESNEKEEDSKKSNEKLEDKDVEEKDENSNEDKEDEKSDKDVKYEKSFEENAEKASEESIKSVDDAAKSSEDLTAENAAQMANAQETQTEKVGAVNGEKQEENSSSAPLTDSERAEFEALKREKKENLLNSYKDCLSEDEYNGFFATIDSTSNEELESNLLKIYKRKKEEEETVKPSRAFSLSAILNLNEKKESSLSSLIKENL